MLDPDSQPAAPPVTAAQTNDVLCVQISDQIELERGRHVHAETMARIGRTELLLHALITGPVARYLFPTAAATTLHLLNVPGFDLRWFPH